MSSQKGPSEKDPLAKVNSQTWSTWRTPAGRDPPRYSISPSVSCRAWSTWRTPARGISPRYSTIPSVRSRARSTWKTPASRAYSRYSISNDVNPQSYAHAYPLILLHLNTELITTCHKVTVKNSHQLFQTQSPTAMSLKLSQPQVSIMSDSKTARPVTLLYI